MKLNIKAVKIAMAKKQMNAPDLAEAIGVSKSVINYWLSEKRQPTTKSVGALAIALGCDVTDIIE